MIEKATHKLAFVWLTISATGGGIMPAATGVVKSDQLVEVGRHDGLGIGHQRPGCGEQFRVFGGAAAFDFDQGVYKFPTGICQVRSWRLSEYAERRAPTPSVFGQRCDSRPAFMRANFRTNSSRQSLLLNNRKPLQA
jgi:hypothetical protein